MGRRPLRIWEGIGPGHDLWPCRSLFAIYVSAALVKVFRGDQYLTNTANLDARFPVAVALAAAATVLVANRIGAPVSTTHALTGLAGSGSRRGRCWTGQVGHCGNRDWHASSGIAANRCGVNTHRVSIGFPIDQIAQPDVPYGIRAADEIS